MKIEDIRKPQLIVFIEGNEMKSRYNKEEVNILELIGFLELELMRLKQDHLNNGFEEE